MAVIELLVSDKFKPRGKGFEDENYQPGDIIDIKTTHFVWGRKEDIRIWIRDGNHPNDFPGNTYIVRVIDVPRPRIEHILSWCLEEEYRHTNVLDKEHTAEELEDRFVRTHRRIYKLDTSLLSNVARLEIKDRRYTEITFSDFEAACKHKKTGDRVGKGKKPQRPIKDRSRDDR